MELMLLPRCVFYFLPLSFTFLSFAFVFIVKPSKPRCYADNPTQEGKDIVLRCLSSEGTAPVTYTWDKTSDNKLLPASAVMGNGSLYKYFKTNAQQF